MIPRAIVASVQQALADTPVVFVNNLFDGTVAKARALSVREDIPRRLVRGGYPEATERKTENRRSAWFASYISTILQRDVRELARVDSLHALPNLLKLLAARTSGLLNLADVGRDAGLPHTTLTRYLTLLETVFLVHRLPAWSANLGKRLVKAPKLHLVDTGLACALSGRSNSSFWRQTLARPGSHPLDELAHLSCHSLNLYCTRRAMTQMGRVG